MENTSKDIHEQLRSILEKAGNTEFGDVIIDEICTIFNFPTTIGNELEQAYQVQVKLQQKMQSNGLNLINCNGSDCSNVLIHPNDKEEIIICPCCGHENYPNDCSDFYY